MSDITQRFADKWYALANALGLDAATANDVGNALLAHYSESTRHYHTARHIVSMLDGFEPLKEKFNAPLAAELAIFFHDAIYDPARHDNEEQSARLMKALLSGKVDAATLDAATYSIEATKKHAATPNADTNRILDLDMAILGQPWAVYERYAMATMQEYLPVYGETAYRQGRPKLFLEPTIAHGTIFLTDDFQHLNEPAIRNMKREVEILTSGKPFLGKHIDGHS